MDYLATIQAPIRQEIDDFTNYFKLQFTSNVELLNSALSYVRESVGKMMRPMLPILKSSITTQRNATMPQTLFSNFLSVFAAISVPP